MKLDRILYDMVCQDVFCPVCKQCVKNTVSFLRFSNTSFVCPILNEITVVKSTQGYSVCHYRINK